MQCPVDRRVDREEYNTHCSQSLNDKWLNFIVKQNYERKAQNYRSIKELYSNEELFTVESHKDVINSVVASH